MNKEDYFKYYIQGSDHYLIPRDIFEELFNEMNNWKEESKATKEVAEEHLKKEIQYKEVIEEVREVINKMIYTGYMLEKDNSATQFMATNKKSEFGIRAEVLLQILDKGVDK